MRRWQAQLDGLIEALTYLGYRFDVKSRPEAVDWALEIRLNHAIEYAQRKMRKKPQNPLAVFDHPALKWVRDEKIVLPSRFAPHPQAPSICNADPDAAAELARLEQRVGGPVPESLKEWFRTCGSVDLRGRHPFLNPQGKLHALHIAPLRECVDAFKDGWMPLAPGDDAGEDVLGDAWKVRLPDPAADATLADGRKFSDALHNALHWAGVPGLATAARMPERELQYIRSRMEAA
jgi:hypothetical protein